MEGRKMKRTWRFAVPALSVFLLMAIEQPLAAAKFCQGTACRVYISKQLVPVIAQQTPVWCWAASLSMLFGYYGHPVQQDRIVERYFVLPLPVTGSPLVMKDALNSTWTDDTGKMFQVTSAVTDLYSGLALQVTNADVVNALANEKPVYYGDDTHAMILVQVDYFDNPPPLQPTIVAGWVIDPWPLSLGFRQLQPNELSARFLAVSTVTDVSPPKLPLITRTTNAASYLAEITPQGFGTIFGQNLAPAIGTWDSSIVNSRLPITLQGVRVLINNKDAYISYASPTQINFLAPSSTAAGTVPITVTTAAGSTSGSVLQKARSIGVFENQWFGKNYAVAQPASAPALLIGPASAIPGRTRPAVRGEFLQIYATGLGATTPAAADGAVIKAPFPTIAPSAVLVRFGSVSATPAFVGMTYAGVFQINVQVPTNAPTGDALFSIQIAGDLSQSNTYLTIQ
jgi:uncharacterized protein (TIGR03437 family)